MARFLKTETIDIIKLECYEMCAEYLPSVSNRRKLTSKIMLIIHLHGVNDPLVCAIGISFWLTPCHISLLCKIFTIHSTLMFPGASN